ncbi:uncharacterized protein Z520_09549 [Fonsecaea multimorphosa CBS 102226]|uniref:Uncharacterized protein n=1 Tax=Fonsecaea multimorphosa CBS 102226 TaxID=1442371 RepID=A0A0D2JWH2_9EURO|nr:uncharacterized protein Z520_09549 [Fonsecaea multimorphosa CBS 102226]KIX94859.1 hypothetical protein Z520_09549 [Fonsecaea multimorphosa CBS 102226]OAL20436.1 hypothetical protein AYO22_08930 [Fonsecaea multimorphosa]
MKSFLAIPALFALGAVADSWGFTWTFSNEHSTWTSCTYASENATTTTASSEVSTTSSGPWSEWIYTTSYTATYSSGASTWGIPTAVSYSEASNFTSMIPAVTSSTAASVTSSALLTTSVAATSTSVAASSTSAAASTFTGAAAPNVNGKIAGMGAVAMAGLALVL